MLSSLLIATCLFAKTRSWGRQLSIFEQWYKTQYETTMIVSSWRQGKHVSRKPEQSTGSVSRYATGEIKKLKKLTADVTLRKIDITARLFGEQWKKLLCCGCQEASPKIKIGLIISTDEHPNTNALNKYFANAVKSPRSVVSVRITIENRLFSKYVVVG